MWIILQLYLITVAMQRQCVQLVVIVSYNALHSTRCTSCLKYRCILRANYSNYSKSKDSTSASMPSSHTNLRFTGTPQRSLHISKRRNEVKAQKRKITALENKIAKLINKNGIAVDKHLHDDLADIMGSISTDGTTFPEGFFRQLFWL